MIKKIVRKSICLALSLTLALSLAACGSQSNEPASENVTTSVDATTEATTEETTEASDDKSDSQASGVLPYDGDELVSKYASFDVTSKNLNNGVWDDVISNTDEGENKSPELSWEPVEDASVYAIYMIDISMHYFIHWNSNDITETSLAEGWAPSSDYVGPYPPEGGEHTYDIYVIAMKNPIERLKGGVNSQTLNAQDFIDSTDTDIDGNTGNIVAIGHLSGNFTNH